MALASLGQRITDAAGKTTKADAQQSIEPQAGRSRHALHIVGGRR